MIKSYQVDAAMSMEFLLHHLQGERAASCGAVVSAESMQGRENALIRLLEQRSKTDNAMESARHNINASSDAQRALSDRVSVREGSTFTNISMYNFYLFLCICIYFYVFFIFV